MACSILILKDYAGVFGKQCLSTIWSSVISFMTFILVKYKKKPWIRKFSQPLSIISNHSTHVVSPLPK